jgi:hypothetical protein
MLKLVIEKVKRNLQYGLRMRRHKKIMKLHKKLWGVL